MKAKAAAETSPYKQVSPPAHLLAGRNGQTLKLLHHRSHLLLALLGALTGPCIHNES